MMDGLGKWLVDLSWPLVARVLAALGIGTVTYTGMDAALTAGFNAAKGAFAGMGTDILQLVAMAGFFDAMSITSGGVISALAFMTMKRFALKTTGT